MAMIIKLPTDKTFHLPEGNFRGSLASISKRPNGNHKEETVRFVFDMKVPSIRNAIPCAGRNFPLHLKGGTELRRFLEGWLGKEFFEANGGKSLDLESLIGREADLVLVHFQQTGYPRPMVFVQAAYKPGSLRLTEEPILELEGHR
jgi:hypothetical protein